jgi:hypothetical protein
MTAPSNPKRTNLFIFFFSFNFNVKIKGIVLILELYHPYVGMNRIRLRGYHLSRQQTAPLDKSGAKVDKNV